MLSGGRALASMWAVLGCAYGVSVAVAWAFGLAGWLWLAGALDGSLATRSLLTALDANVFVDLVMHHGESLRALGVTAAILLALGAMAGIWVNAALVAAAGGAEGARQAVCRGWGLFPVFLRLWLLALPVAGVGMWMVAHVVRGTIDWAAGRGLSLPPLAVVAAGMVIGAGLLLLLATVHDHARIRSAAAPAAGAVRAYAWAWAFVWRHATLALPLAAVLGLVAAAVWTVGLGLREAVPTTTATGVAVALVVAQFGALARTVVRGWWFAAETALQQRAAGPAP